MPAKRSKLAAEADAIETEQLTKMLEPLDAELRASETSKARRMLDELPQTPANVRRIVLAFIEEMGDVPQLTLRGMMRGQSHDVIEDIRKLREQRGATRARRQ